MNKVFEKIIEKLEEKIVVTWEHDYEGGREDAFNEAIEIVKQEAEKYNNTIIDGKYCFQSCACTEKCDKCSRLCNGDIDWYENIDNWTEYYNNGWIPCSERLPEESGYYLVTYHDWSDGNFLPKYDDTYVRRLHYQISEHFVGWNYPKNVDDRAENDCHKEVIAWQPLPEPFKERD